MLTFYPRKAEKERRCVLKMFFLIIKPSKNPFFGVKASFCKQGSPMIWLTRGQEILTPEASFPGEQSQGNRSWLRSMRLEEGDTGKTQEMGKKGAVRALLSTLFASCTFSRSSPVSSMPTSCQ